MSNVCSICSSFNYYSISSNIAMNGMNKQTSIIWCSKQTLCISLVRLFKFMLNANEHCKQTNNQREREKNESDARHFLSSSIVLHSLSLFLSVSDFSNRMQIEAANKNKTKQLSKTKGDNIMPFCSAIYFVFEMGFFFVFKLSNRERNSSDANKITNPCSFNGFPRIFSLWHLSFCDV